jgi:hypothetical protein
MTPHPLDDARLKWERARTLIEDELVPQVETFLTQDPRPYAVRTERSDAGRDEAILRVHVSRQPPREWGVVIGDIAHNLRSALDHTVYQLAVQGGKNPPSRGTEFPIFLDSAVYHARTPKGDPQRGSGEYKVRDLDQKAQALVESVQPYRGDGVSDPLWLLHELSNADKHRVLSVGVSALEETGFNILPKRNVSRIVGYRIGPFDIFEDGAEVGRVQFERTDPDDTVDMDVTLTYMVAFGEGTDADGRPLPIVGMPLLRTLKAIAERVTTVIGHAQFFYSEPPFWPAPQVQTTVVLTQTLPVQGGKNFA